MDQGEMNDSLIGDLMLNLDYDDPELAMYESSLLPSYNDVCPVCHLCARKMMCEGRGHDNSVNGGIVIGNFNTNHTGVLDNVKYSVKNEQMAIGNVLSQPSTERKWHFVSDGPHITTNLPHVAELKQLDRNAYQKVVRKYDHMIKLFVIVNTPRTQ